MSDPAAYEAALRHVGYAVLPGVYSEAYLRQATAELDRLYSELGRPPMSCSGRRQHPHPTVNGFTTPVGVTLAKLLAHAPTLTSGFLHPKVLDAVRHVLGDDLRIETTGATISDDTRPIHAWHRHIGGPDEDMPEAERPGRVDPDRIGRLSLLIYLHELGPETGSLLVYPRKLSDPLECPFPNDLHQQWPGQVALSGPPGTAVLVEERTWHASLPRTGPGTRRFLGAWLGAGWLPACINFDDSVPAFEDAALHRSPDHG
ncbi:hypothetical protein DB30_00501 [Enhygromyxa salina]|uniref:Uncharacterized protein n=1 Tax=Enhygromyxa salina TaxID=215803 RepID=A0A0C1ZQ56_9BACT|nr:phytanoyl-CoA dioxygenase family protein [Enhygromyxa salina]KIG13123.1 hypothetical protein DB30_00501 [Enhygromyxa salina]